MLVTKRGMTGGVPLYPLAVNHGLFTEFFRLDKSCESIIVLRVVGAGFTRSNGLYEGIRLVLVETNKYIESPIPP